MYFYALFCIFIRIVTFAITTTFFTHQKEHTFSVFHKFRLCSINPAYKSPSPLITQGFAAPPLSPIDSSSQNNCLLCHFRKPFRPYSHNALSLFAKSQKSQNRLIKNTRMQEALFPLHAKQRFFVLLYWNHRRGNAPTVKTKYLASQMIAKGLT